MAQATRGLDWSGYTAKLRRQGRVDLFVSPDLVAAWRYKGVRRPGGVLRFPEAVIEACLVVREVFGLALRQTQGFVQSLLDTLGCHLQAPDYSTLCRRARRLNVRLGLPSQLGRGEALVLAVDATGLSLHGAHGWHRFKHRKAGHREVGANHRAGHKGWRKLHVAVDTASGLVVSAAFGSAGEPDHRRLGELVEAVHVPIHAVCADMAYDKEPARAVLHARTIRQLIPPQRNARLSKDNPNLAHKANTLAERDQAITFIQSHVAQGSLEDARALWKQTSGFHARSLVETAFARLKAHTAARLANKREDTRQTEAFIRCRAINLMALA